MSTDQPAGEGFSPGSAAACLAAALQQSRTAIARYLPAADVCDQADLYVLTNKSGASAEITNYGGIIRAINVPDKTGKLGNVVLGYNDVAGYCPTKGYLGALIGRVGNRIAGAKFDLEGKTYIFCILFYVDIFKCALSISSRKTTEKCRRTNETTRLHTVHHKMCLFA